MTMKVAVLVLAAACSACLLDAPLAPGQPEPLDRRLLGQWRCVAPENTDPSVLTVTEESARHYQARFDDEDSAFSIYVVKFNGQQLFNAQEVVSGERRKWTLGRYTLFRPGLLHIEAARDEPFQAASANIERVAILKRQLKSGALFEDYCSCVRVKEK